jgi:hypothetical protein
MKSLSSKPNIEFLKNTAKSLRSLHEKGNPGCCEPIRTYDISFKSKSNSEILKAKFSIIDAQRIVAREYGYPSWSTLKDFIESLDSPLNRGVSDKVAYH